MMLNAREFAVGTLAEATPGTLMLPRTPYELTLLVGQCGDQTTAMFLDGKFRFSNLPSAGNSHWKGLIIPGVELIVDPASLFDPDERAEPLGSVVRSGSYLAVVAKSNDQYGFHNSIRINLHGSLPASPSELKAGFLRWQLALGSGAERRVLFEMDLRKKDKES